MKYYWVDRGIKTHEVAINNIKKYDSQKIKQLIIIQYDLLKVEMIVGKDWPHTGNVHSLFEVDGNEVFLLIAAKRRDYPESEIWRHFFDVFAENWQNFFQDNDLETILKIPSPTDALSKIFFYLGLISTTCDRIIAEGGFFTGYGDPVESSWLFGVISLMSSKKYERRESEGYIVSVSGPEDLVIKLQEPINIYNTSNLNIDLLRKLLELTRNGLALAVKNEEIVGLVDPSKYEYKIQITGMNQWRVCKNGEVLFEVKDNKINISIPISEVRHFIDEDKKDGLSNPDFIEVIIGEASKQTHGTSIIFSDEAKKKEKRLSEYNSCTLIDPIDIVKHSNLILSLTSIDGALLVDFNGKCYGVGAILDGKAVVMGNLGRGARYNSAVNYVAWRKQESKDSFCCAVIISEDGAINVYTTNTIEKIDDE